MSSLPFVDKRDRTRKNWDNLYATYSGTYPWFEGKHNEPEGWYAELLQNGKWFFFNYRGADLFPMNDPDEDAYVRTCLQMLRTEPGASYSRAG